MVVLVCLGYLGNELLSRLWGLEQAIRINKDPVINQLASHGMSRTGRVLNTAHINWSTRFFFINPYIG